MKKPFTSDEHVPIFADAQSRDSFKKGLKKGFTAPLFMYRSVINASDIMAWAKAQGFKSIVAADEMHVTIIYSTTPLDWFALGDDWAQDAKGQLTINPGGPRAVQALGDKGAVVLMFASSQLSYRNMSAQDRGASWDYAEFQPHVTLTYDVGDIDLSKVEPYTGKIILGPEMFEPIETEYVPAETSTVILKSKIAKVDNSHGIVFGWAVVCKINGTDYYDRNIDLEGDLAGQHVGENVTEPAMLKSSIVFMEKSRQSNERHKGPDAGMYVFGFPLTTDIAKSMGITSTNTGFMVGFKPNSPEILAKFQSGEYSGFSIEGSRIEFTEVDDG